MNDRELDGVGQGAARWIAPKLVMLTAVGESQGGIVPGVQETVNFVSGGGAIIKGSIGESV